MIHHRSGRREVFVCPEDDPDTGAGVLLVARGEFSIVIAALGLTAGVDERLGVLAVGYVLVTAVIGPVAAKIVDTRAVSRPGPRLFGRTSAKSPGSKNRAE